MTTGSEFAAAFLATPFRKGDGYSPEREGMIRSAFFNGQAPDFILKNEWGTITNKARIDGVERTCKFWISPFLAVGTDEDPLVTCMTPETAQAIANHLDSFILCKKLVRDYFFQANKKIPIQVPGAPLKIPGPDMNTPQAIIAHNKMITAAGGGHPSNINKVAGHSKNVVVGPGIKAGRLAIYGGYGGSYDGWAVQPYPGPHPSDWVDYSQCVQLVFGKCELDGKVVDTRGVFLDPYLNVLASDQGPFDPVYPSTAGGGGPVTTLPPRPPATIPPKPPSSSPPKTPKPPVKEILGGKDGTGSPVLTAATALLGAFFLIGALRK